MFLERHSHGCKFPLDLSEPGLAGSLGLPGLGLAFEQPGFFYPNYTSINRIVASRSGVRSLVTLNETSFLRGTGLPMGLVQKG